MLDQQHMKEAPHLVCINHTKIFETYFFIFQTMGSLIYELALEFHCKKVTDEGVKEHEMLVRRGGENEFILTYRFLSSVCSLSSRTM